MLCWVLLSGNIKSIDFLTLNLTLKNNIKQYFSLNDDIKIYDSFNLFLCFK